MKYSLIFIAFSLVLSCATFTINKEVYNSSAIAKSKSTGIIFRISKGSHVEQERYKESLAHWLSGYKRKKDFKIISDTSEELVTVSSEYDKFYQFSEDGEFLAGKSLGVIAHFVLKNEAELKKIMADNSLDSLLIYEIDGSLSPEMQFFDFKSCVVFLDSNFKVSYFDNQSDFFDSNEIDTESMINFLLDKINQRLIEVMLKLSMIKEL
jgi:hypothetical protein